LWNFLGTYISRYTDYNGYWLFGFLVSDLEELELDLLEPKVSDAKSLLGVTVLWASAKFHEQVEKAALPRAYIKNANLKITKSPMSTQGAVNGRISSGYNMNFMVQSVMDNGKHHERKRSIFVAPHNANIEIKSARAV
jgi:hypothetical protein